MSEEKMCGNDDDGSDVDVDLNDSDDTISASIFNDSSMVDVVVSLECCSVRLDSSINVATDSDCPSVRLDSDFISGDCGGCCCKSNGERNGERTGDNGDADELVDNDADDDDDEEVVLVSLGVISASSGVDQPLLPLLLIMLRAVAVPKDDIFRGIIPSSLVLVLMVLLLLFDVAAVFCLYSKKTLTTSSSSLGALNEYFLRTLFEL